MASGYALFNNQQSDKIDTPDHASLDIVGDIDIRALSADELGGDQWMITKWGEEDITGASYYLYINGASDSLAIVWWDSVLDEFVELQSDTTFSTVDPVWTRATLDVNNGSSQSVAHFYTSNDPINTVPASVSWVQLGGPVVGAVATINATNAPVTIGNTSEGTSSFIGKIYYAEIRNGINGTIVADPDFRDADQKTGDSPTTFTDTTGKVWTFDTAVWVPPSGGGRRKTRPPRNPRRYSV